MMRLVLCSIVLAACGGHDAPSAVSPAPAPAPPAVAVDAGVPRGVTAADCDAACRNYFTLHYSAKADEEIAAAAADRRDALRREKTDHYAAELQSGLGMCVSQCRGSPDPLEATCMANAKTPQAAEACVPSDQ